ncbi:LPXTG cell wall anchor domain-containing protein [Cellulomonas sp.]|uniref:LPXTG cell wall anchor domain-containing protein n=1 Tax=Cellulomonas sp. TaxID=40001 RepID=UPI001B10B2BF|nr:LPXTG cell wall anchor domain-containing protein [Cellulomonas sp.]MBO9553350.1 LPXTG cell wall anchor domain-containing protein [Cellulomonas sp.]
MLPRPRTLAIALTALALLAAGAPPVAAQVDPSVTGRLSLFKRIENLDTGASEGRRELWTMHAVNTEDPTYTFSGNGLNGVQSLEVPAGDYTISESDGVPGYAFVSWDCGGAGTFTTPTPTITVPAGGNVTCTVRNDAQQAFLTLRKVVVGGPSSPTAWNLFANGPTNVKGTDGVRVAVRIGQYQLSESSGPNGYTPSDWVCTGGQQVSGSSVVVALGQDVVCTITNTREVATPHLLTLVKDVAGGPATPADFQLTAAGPQTVQGPSGSPTVTQVPVPSGTYALSELPLSAPASSAYSAGAWSCTAGTVTGATLTLADSDGDVTCRVTNTYTGGYLTLVKVALGGSVVPQAWTLSATGAGGTVAGATGSPEVTHVAVPAGTYALAEQGPTNYSASPWSCTSGGDGPASVTVAAGADITCTIVNTIETASLTLVKQVDNTGGGTAAPGDFFLRAVSDQGVVMAGPSGSPLVTHVRVATGQTWSLGEDPVPGYAAGPWTCDGVVAVDDVVTISTPADVTCTVTNTWTGGYLTLVKEVVGSSTDPSAWDLSATGPDGVTRTGRTGEAAVTRIPVPAGDYTLTEEQVAGFTASPWDCGAAPVAGAVVSVGTGDDVVCTVTNTATEPHLTLRKVVDSTAGGTLGPTSWQLTADGPVQVSGVTGTDAVTLVAVPPGTYALSESPASTPDYDASAWVCVSGPGTTPVVGDSVTIPATNLDGSPWTDDVTCTVVNTAVAPRLTLRKVVDNSGGGEAAPGAFVLLGVGPDLLVGTTGGPAVTDVPVRAGTYSLLEIGLPRYALDGWTCVDDIGAPVPVVGGGVTLDLGDDVTCTATNRWTGAQLRLTKQVLGGPSVATDWTLVGSPPIGGFGGVSGRGGVVGVVGPGSVELHEIAQTAVAERGYVRERWDCGEGHPVTAGDRVAVVANEEVTCTAVNRWVGSTLTLTKAVEGGTAAPEDWTLTALGDTGPVSGASGSVAVTRAFVVPGTYALAESGGPAGYRSEGWACTGATVLGDLLLVEGERDVECTVTNVAVPPVPPTPGPTPDPTAPPAGPDDPGAPTAAGGLVLSATGAETAPALLLAGALVALGLGALVAARRRRT